MAFVQLARGITREETGTEDRTGRGPDDDIRAGRIDAGVAQAGENSRHPGSADEATETYRALLADPAQAEELGRRARERVLDEHTFAMRARRLLNLVV